MRAVSTTVALDHRRACDGSDTYAGSGPHDLAIRAGRVNQHDEVVGATCEFWTSSPSGSACYPPPCPTFETEIGGINSAGQIVGAVDFGYWIFGDYFMHGFLYSAGRFTTIDVP